MKSKFLQILILKIFGSRLSVATLHLSVVTLTNKSGATMHQMEAELSIANFALLATKIKILWRALEQKTQVVKSL